MLQRKRRFHLYDPNFESQELRWAIVLQYTLLKILGYSQKTDVYDFLRTQLNYVYEDTQIINKFTQEKYRQALLDQKQMDKAYLYLYYTELDDLITPPMLIQNLHTMKTDVELKILAELFNYTYLYQAGEDFTGAIYFTKKQITRRILSQSAKTKWRKLEHLSNQQTNVILYGQAHHWLAIRGIYRKYQLNPSLGSTNEDPIQTSSDMEYMTQSTPSESSDPSLIGNNSKEQERPDNSDNSLETNHSDTLSENISVEEPLFNKAKLAKIKENVKKKNRQKRSTLDQIKQIFELEPQEDLKWKTKHLILDLNDPTFCQQDKVNYNELAESDRFYVFQKRETEDCSILEKIVNYTRIDFKKELKIWQTYLSADTPKEDNKERKKKHNDVDSLHNFL